MTPGTSLCFAHSARDQQAFLEIWLNHLSGGSAFDFICDTARGLRLGGCGDSVFGGRAVIQTLRFLQEAYWKILVFWLFAFEFFDAASPSFRRHGRGRKRDIGLVPSSDLGWQSEQLEELPP